jgi:hypothetical protein
MNRGLNGDEIICRTALIVGQPLSNFAVAPSTTIR